MHSISSSTISRDSLDLKMIGYIPHIQADGTFRGKFLSNLVNINNKVVFNLSLSRCFPLWDYLSCLKSDRDVTDTYSVGVNTRMDLYFLEQHSSSIRTSEWQLCLLEWKYELWVHPIG